MLHYDFRVIRSLRKKRKLTLVQLAEKSNVTYPTLISIETNKSVPSLMTLDQIASALEIQTASLILLCQRCKSLKGMAEPIEQIALPAEAAIICRMSALGEIKLFHISAETDMHTVNDYQHGEVFELAYVLEGDVEITIQTDIHVLHVHNTFLFDGSLTHFYRYLTKSEILVVHIPKNNAGIHALLR
jgi:transcriptional regulator with XRE-family HTH domain